MIRFAQPAASCRVEGPGSRMLNWSGALSMATDDLVARPTKKSEYSIRSASAGARKGWRDLVATIRNPMADTGDFLARPPVDRTPANYPLRGELQFLQRDGKTYERWQHKPTLRGDAWNWFYVEGQTVFIERVHTHHPNAIRHRLLEEPSHRADEQTIAFG